LSYYLILRLPCPPCTTVCLPDELSHAATLLLRTLPHCQQHLLSPVLGSIVSCLSHLGSWMGLDLVLSPPICKWSHSAQLTAWCSSPTALYHWDHTGLPATPPHYPTRFPCPTCLCQTLSLTWPVHEHAGWRTRDHQHHADSWAWRLVAFALPHCTHHCLPPTFNTWAGVANAQRACVLLTTLFAFCAPSSGLR